MEDFFDDFDNGDFIDGDFFEDKLDSDTEKDEPFDGDPVQDDEPEQPELQGDELTVNPIIICGAMGIAYEEGLRERKHRKRKKFSDDSK